MRIRRGYRPQWTREAKVFRQYRNEAEQVLRIPGSRTLELHMFQIHVLGATFGKKNLISSYVQAIGYQ